MVWACAVAVTHGAAVLTMLAGPLVALRRPWFLLVHVPVSLAILVVNLDGADCPLTTLELWLRSRAGGPGYRGGFLGHYVLAPMGFDAGTPQAQIGIYTVAVLPNLLGYGLLAGRALRRPAAGMPVRRAAKAPAEHTPAMPGVRSGRNSAR